jgi:hypothetical protein
MRDWLLIFVPTTMRWSSSRQSAVGGVALGRPVLVAAGGIADRHRRDRLPLRLES